MELICTTLEIKHITNILHCIQFNKYQPNYKNITNKSSQHILKKEIENIERQMLALKTIKSSSATNKLSNLNELLQQKRSRFMKQQRWTRNSRRYRERRDARYDHLEDTHDIKIRKKGPGQTRLEERPGIVLFSLSVVLKKKT